MTPDQRESSLADIDRTYRDRLRTHDEDYARSVDAAAAIKTLSDLRATNERRIAIAKVEDEFNRSMEDA